MFHILTIKSSANSLKYQLFDEDEKELSSGCIDEITDYGQAQNQNIPVAEKGSLRDEKFGSGQALKQVLRNIKDLQKISAVGHYVADGGEEFIKPVVIDERVLERLEELSETAPQMNPYNLAGIKACLEYLDLPQVAVFDNAFFAALPESFGAGINGLSHQSTMMYAAEKTKKKPAEINIISCHLEETCSVCAIKKGRPIDISENFSLSEEIKDEQDYTVFLREITFNREIKLALDAFVHKVKRQIGAGFAVLGGEVNALVFTGFISTNRPTVRNRIIQGLDFLGKKVKVLTVENGEGLMIAKEVRKLLK